MEGNISPVSCDSSSSWELIEEDSSGDSDFSAEFVRVESADVVSYHHSQDGPDSLDSEIEILEDPELNAVETLTPAEMVQVIEGLEYLELPVLRVLSTATDSCTFVDHPPSSNISNTSGTASRSNAEESVQDKGATVMLPPLPEHHQGNVSTNYNGPSQSLSLTSASNSDKGTILTVAIAQMSVQPENDGNYHGNVKLTADLSQSSDLDFVHIHELVQADIGREESVGIDSGALGTVQLEGHNDHSNGCDEITENGQSLKTQQAPGIVSGANESIEDILPSVQPEGSRVDRHTVVQGDESAGSHGSQKKHLDVASYSGDLKSPRSKEPTAGVQPESNTHLCSEPFTEAQSISARCSSEDRLLTLKEVLIQPDKVDGEPDIGMSVSAKPVEEPNLLTSDVPKSSPIGTVRAFGSRTNATDGRVGPSRVDYEPEEDDDGVDDESDTEDDDDNVNTTGTGALACSNINSSASCSLSVDTDDVSYDVTDSDWTTENSSVNSTPSASPCGMIRAIHRANMVLEEPACYESEEYDSDIDERVESDMSSSSDDDHFDQSSTDTDIGVLAMIQGSRLYRHKPNVSVNTMLTTMVSMTMMMAVGLAIGHYAGLYLEDNITVGPGDKVTLPLTNLQQILEDRSELSDQQEVLSRQLSTCTEDVDQCDNFSGSLWKDLVSKENELRSLHNTLQTLQTEKEEFEEQLNNKTPVHQEERLENSDPQHLPDIPAVFVVPEKKTSYLFGGDTVTQDIYNAVMHYTKGYEADDLFISALIPVYTKLQEAIPEPSHFLQVNEEFQMTILDHMTQRLLEYKDSPDEAAPDPDLLDHMMTHWRALHERVANYSQYVRQTYGLHLEQVIGAISPVVEHTKDIIVEHVVPAASDMAATVKEAAGYTYDNVKEAAGLTYDNVKEAAGFTYDNVKEAAGFTYDNVKEAAGFTYDNVKEAAGFTYANVKSMAAGYTYENVKEAAGYTYENVKSMAAKVKDNVVPMMRDAVSSVKEDVLPRVYKTAENVKNKAKEIQRELRVWWRERNKGRRNEARTEVGGVLSSEEKGQSVGGGGAVDDGNDVVVEADETVKIETVNHETVEDLVVVNSDEALEDLVVDSPDKTVEDFQIVDNPDDEDDDPDDEDDDPDDETDETRNEEPHKYPVQNEYLEYEVESEGKDEEDNVQGSIVQKQLRLSLCLLQIRLQLLSEDGGDFEAIKEPLQYAYNSLRDDNIVSAGMPPHSYFYSEFESLLLCQMRWWRSKFELTSDDMMSSMLKECRLTNYQKQYTCRLLGIRAGATGFHPQTCKPNDDGESEFGNKYIAYFQKLAISQLKQHPSDVTPGVLLAVRRIVEVLAGHLVTLKPSDFHMTDISGNLEALSPLIPEGASYRDWVECQHTWWLAYDHPSDHTGSVLDLCGGHLTSWQIDHLTHWKGMPICDTGTDSGCVEYQPKRPSKLRTAPRIKHGPESVDWTDREQSHVMDKQRGSAMRDVKPTWWLRRVEDREAHFHPSDWYWKNENNKKELAKDKTSGTTNSGEVKMTKEIKCKGKSMQEKQKCKQQKKQKREAKKQARRLLKHVNKQAKKQVRLEKIQEKQLRMESWRNFKFGEWRKNYNTEL